MSGRSPLAELLYAEAQKYGLELTDFQISSSGVAMAVHSSIAVELLKARPGNPAPVKLLDVSPCCYSRWEFFKAGWGFCSICNMPFKGAANSKPHRRDIHTFAEFIHASAYSERFENLGFDPLTAELQAQSWAHLIKVTFDHITFSW